MWTEHTEYEEYHKLQLCTVFRYQHNNTLGKISSNYRYRKKSTKISRYHFFQYRTPLVWTQSVYLLWVQCLFQLSFCTACRESLSPQPLTSHSVWGRSRPSHPSAAIDVYRTGRLAPGGGDLQALFMLEFGTAPDSDPSPCLVSSEQSCQAHFRFHCSSHWSRAVFSEVMRYHL